MSRIDDLVTVVEVYHGGVLTASLGDDFFERSGPCLVASVEAGDTPSVQVDFTDIAKVTEAFQNKPYPYDGPSGCPP